MTKVYVEKNNKKLVSNSACYELNEEEIGELKERIAGNRYLSILLGLRPLEYIHVNELDRVSIKLHGIPEQKLKRSLSRDVISSLRSMGYKMG